MRVKFYCPQCNEWSAEWVKVTQIPSPKQSARVHQNEVHQCWILVDYEIEAEKVGLTV